MTIATQSPPVAAAPAPAAPPLEFYRWTVDQYDRLIDLGILTNDDRVELLEGHLVTKMSINPPHRISTRKVRIILERLLPAGWYADEQKPITTSDSEPEPDVSIVRGDSSNYSDCHPGPPNVALVVEVAASSLARDQVLKKRIYAVAGIPDYWIVNHAERRREVYSDPSGPDVPADYRRRIDCAESGDVALVLDGREVGRIAMRDLLP